MIEWKVSQPIDIASVSFDTGLQAFKKGCYVEALGHFKASSRIRINVRASLYAAKCFEALGLLDLAKQAYIDTKGLAALLSRSDEVVRASIESVRLEIDQSLARLTNARTIKITDTIVKQV